VFLGSSEPPLAEELQVAGSSELTAR